MEAPAYLLPRPPLDLTPEKKAAFEGLFQTAPVGSDIDYQLPYPKWQFLSYLCDAHECVLHGSQNRTIQEVRPQQARDIRSFSSQCVIYATTDGIWAIFFAILDRQRYPAMGLFNSCLQARMPGDRLSDPLYFFSITHAALIQEPWCTGAVYILPRQSFLQEAPQPAQGMEIIFPHWIGSQPTLPAASLQVDPTDFPFLSKIHGHDDEKLTRLAMAYPNDFQAWMGAIKSE